MIDLFPKQISPDVETLEAKLNRTTAVNEEDSGYTTYMARGEALFTENTVPPVNGTIAWKYE